jgi:hypothetical protein
LPIVEAGRFGKPVIASDIPVFREVSTGAIAATFFEVGNAMSLAQQLREFIATHQTREISKEGSGTEAVRWPSWRESSEELERILDQQEWYQTYQPSSQRLFADGGDIGSFELEELLPRARRAYEIEMIGEPESLRNGDSGFLVVVRNNSDTTWSSDGPSGLHFAALVRDACGTLLNPKPARVSLPFVLGPQSACFMKMVVPRELMRRPGQSVEFVPGQGDEWWTQGHPHFYTP